MTHEHDIIHHDVKILLDVKEELDYATRIQPCPACRYDMEQLGIFLKSKIESIRASSVVENKAARILKDLNYINELSSIGIFIARVSKPIFKLRFFTVPLVYKGTLDRNRAANIKIRKHLLLARLMLTKLEREDRQYAEVSGILGSYLKATEFKLSVDPPTFFLFDKMIRFFYATHLLGFAGKAIVGAKGIVSCCINE